MNLNQIIIKSCIKNSNIIIDKGHKKSIIGQIIDQGLMITLWEKDAFDNCMNLDTKNCYGRQ